MLRHSVAANVKQQVRLQSQWTRCTSRVLPTPHCARQSGQRNKCSSTGCRRSEERRVGKECKSGERSPSCDQNGHVARTASCQTSLRARNDTVRRHAANKCCGTASPQT